MILVDSGVWIDYFRCMDTPQTQKVEQVLGRQELAVGDLILVEVLQGFSNDKDFAKAQFLMTSLKVVNLADEQTSISAAQNDRQLRTLGITVHTTTDTIIATKCIAEGLVLQHSDRDV